MKVLALVLLFAASASLVLVLVEASGRLARNRALTLAAAALAAYAAVLVWRPPPQALGGLVGLVAVALAGGYLGARVVPNLPGLLSFLAVASIVDWVSFSSGPTRALSEAARSGASDLLFYLAILLPWRGGLIAALGVGDLFALGVIFGSLRGQGHARLTVLAVGLAGLFLALAVGLSMGGAPGYPFLALAVVGFLLLSRRRGRADR